MVIGQIFRGVLRLMAAGSLLAFGGCGADNRPQSPGHTDSSAPSAKVDSARGHALSFAPDSSHRENLPAGRFQLPMRHTPAPDLWINLPSGYTVRSVGKMPNDEFFIFRSDDRSLHDTAAITPGFMRIYIGVMPQTALDNGARFSEQRAMLGAYPVVWRLWSERLPDGKSYLQREIKSGDFFAGLSPELAKSPLHLHIYVAGNDSSRVAELMSAAKTISLRP